MSADRRRPLWHHFAIGGLGDMGATLISHPADVLKVRLQLRGELDAKRPAVHLKDYREVARQLCRTDGLRRGLYPGLSAALLRHSIFSTLRHGLYRVFEEHWASSGRSVNLASRIGCGAVAGALAGSVANPCDVVLIRMQADGSLAPSQRRNYRHALDGIVRIAREEGARTLWRGIQPCVLRAMLITTSQNASYGTARSFLGTQLGLQGFGLNICSAICSGTVACLVTSPVDVVKTRIMQSRTSGTYSGPIDCMVQAIRLEGPLALYKGLTATFLRLWPHTVMLFVLQERIDHALAGERVWSSSVPLPKFFGATFEDGTW
eukprot:CAMPEP_0115267566 /NCGR_PEP_ID=MMETSP0270-20121206/52060_1 /TAXON_ID=71861 /ORGANISM="Scrippsiella trochoidea, Strain CCMP3099" /LENGTH=319 /DNA_ID=CAMNT_0002683719 /DNA_START=27 /DNA_END=983 /DNA_ORIENTATION=+